MTTSNIRLLSWATRSLRPSLLAIAAIPVLSVLALYLWHSGAGIHAVHGAAQDAGPWTGSAVFMTAWMLMTAAMMLPSAMPLLASLDRVASSYQRRHEIPAVAAVAYLAVWSVVGIAALIASAAAEAYLLPFASEQIISLLVGASLVLAGLYGLSPLAGACLRACRRPFGFLARYWRGGENPRLQAARIGAAYGISCVGCCVPMLGIMFVVGMASPAVIIAMAGAMVIMKSSVLGAAVARLLSIALVITGLATGFTGVPWPSAAEQRGEICAPAPNDRNAAVSVRQERAVP